MSENENQQEPPVDENEDENEDENTDENVDENDDTQNVENLYNALNGDKTDFQAIIDILATRPLDQRLSISVAYETKYEISLVDDIEKKLRGDLKNLVVAMVTPRVEFFAKELRKAMVGLGTDESTLIEILCSVDNATINSIKSSYNTLFEITLEEDIKDDTSGNFQQFLVSLCNTERNESMSTNDEDALTDAKALKEATSENRWSTYSDIFVHRSLDQLRLILTDFDNDADMTIEEAIQSNFGGDVKEGLLAITGVVKNPAGFFAKRLNKSMAGLGTNDRSLIRLVVTRRDVDIQEIKQEYENQFKETLAAAIIDDTSGDYKTCLLTLIGETEN